MVEENAIQNFKEMKLEDLQTPTLLVDLDVFEENCKRMLATANGANVKLRCQTKTHKTVEGAIIQTGGTKRCIVTSTLNECEMYAEAGFDDILYGFPLLQAHMKRNYKLTAALDEYHVMVSNMEGADILLSATPPPNKRWSVYMKVDCGYPRFGIPSRHEMCEKVARKLASAPSIVNFCGLYAHCGNSYSSDSVEAVHKARDGAIQEIVQLADKFRSLGIPIKEIGTGSTPSCSHPSSSMKQLTEIHPGNYIFYDLQQHLLGSCSKENISASVLTRVVGHSVERNELLIDAGSSALSGQGFEQLNKSLALIKNHDHFTLYKVTQEIGFVRPRNGETIDFASYPLGMLLQLYQYHNCDTASRYPVYHIMKDGVVVDEWRPTRGW